MIQAPFFRLTQALFLLSLLLTSNQVPAKPALWTKQSARFELINNRPGNNLDWVFLPGGPGLGSEYLREFALSLKLPGSTWLLDMPGDGSNQFAGKSLDYNQWPQDLAKAVNSLDHVVLVAHSFGGMLALSSPELQNHLSGLILIDTAPNNQWMHGSGGSCSNCNICESKVELGVASKKHRCCKSSKNVG
jgi:pimeloyl-ACP methyl ester carboxylesterase